jgi:hypothetical protein
VLQPELTAGVIVAYLANGRLSLPKNAAVFDAEDFATDDQRGADSTPPPAEEPGAAPTNAPDAGGASRSNLTH